MVAEIRGTRLLLRGFQASHGRSRVGPIGPELASGAYACLLGPTGAGKTLLLNAIAGLVRSTGVAEANGVGFSDLPVEQRGFALLAQYAWAVPFGTVDAAIHFASGRRRLPRRERARALASLLAEFELEGSAAPASLSPDSRLRVRLAAALASAPRLLLLDDPLANCGDREAAMVLLRGATERRGVTVLHATRSREEAFTTSSYLLLMENGRELQAGTPAQLYEHPSNPFIAGRLGPTNVLAGHLQSLENDVATVQLDCGPVIEASPPELGDVPGARCEILLRPERIAVSALPAAELGAGTIAAIVREVIHQGSAIRLRLAIGTDTEVSVSRPAGLGTKGLIVGRTVSIAWQSQHALTFIPDPTPDRASEP